LFSVYVVSIQVFFFTFKFVTVIDSQFDLICFCVVVRRRPSFFAESNEVLTRELAYPGIPALAAGCVFVFVGFKVFSFACAA
jgi:hypothetical protein